MQLIFDFPVNPRFSFENFVVCSGNETAFRFARLLADDDAKNLLFIHGPPGSGKTHLLRALAGAICRREGRDSISSLSFKDSEQIYRGEFPAESASRLSERLGDEPVLLIDDIHCLPDNPHVRSEFWQLFNDFHDSGRKIAVTGLVPPTEIANLDEHIKSRLMWGLLAGMDISDDASLGMIMKKIAADRNILVPEDVFQYLLCHIRREIPLLVDALDRIHRRSLETTKRISLKLAREALKE
jgi:chromosomal replication initiator protein